MHLLLLLVGCFGVNRDNFWERYFEAVCDKSQECEADAFEAQFDDIEECVDYGLSFVALSDVEDCYEDCDFVTSKAKDCIGAARDIECGDEESYDGDASCNEIYECEDEEAVAACLASGMFGG